MLVALMLVCCARQPAADPGREPGWMPKILKAGASEYLPDFSYAGFREGETALPEAPVTHRIRDFGAIPDDDRDDTAAFKTALERLRNEMGPVVLALEPGHYQLSEVLFIERSDFVLRGAGSGDGGSVLAFEKPLDVLPRVPA